MLFATVVWAQKELLSYNEQNKYTYFQVVSRPGVSADTLKDRALYFLRKNYSKSGSKITDTGAVSATGKFIVYAGISMTRHQAGEISYTINIAYKDQKYKYWLSDFLFTPYKLDRYGSYEPEPGQEMPLEKGLARIEKRPFESYLDQTGTFCKSVGETLKQYMLNISSLPPKDPTKKVISTKDW